MKIPVNQPMLNVDKSEFKPNPEKEDSLLLVDVIITSMTMSLESDNKESGVDKLKKWSLAKRAEAARGDCLDLTIEEAVFIKERVSKTHITLVYGNIHEIFENSKE